MYESGVIGGGSNLILRCCGDKARAGGIYFFLVESR